MRVVKIRFKDSDALYVRKASEDGKWIEIQTNNGGIILYKPKVRFSLLHGVYLEDQVEWDGGVIRFSERTRGYEFNAYSSRTYRG